MSEPRPPDTLEAALARVREAPLALPPVERREEVRTALLAAASLRFCPAPRRRVVRFAALGGVVAAATIAVYAVRPAPDTRLPVTMAIPHASIDRLPGTIVTALSDPPDEVLQLSSGTIHVEVTPLAPGERFRVAVGAAEIEVRGTAFDVTASSDHLLLVRVERGKVEVRPENAPSVLLTAGESWTPPAPPPPPIAPPSPSPEPRPHPHPHPRPSPSPSPSPSLTSEPPSLRTSEPDTSYSSAWQSLRAGEFTAAADGFARTVAAAPGGPLADDAAYWRAVALARVPRPAQAIDAFRAFLVDHPGSSHAGEASAALGWLLVDAGARDEARERFRAATGDPDPRVAKSAQAGLDALERSAQ